jgi:hypothetical protein
MSDMIKDIQRLAHACASGELTVEDIINRLDVISRKGLEQRGRCARALEQCGLYANIGSIGVESKQINTVNIDHTINSEHDDESY